MKITVVGTHVFTSSATKSRLEALGELEFVDEFPSIETMARAAAESQVLITWGRVGRNLLERLDRLQCLVLLSTGYEECLSDDLTAEYIRSRGISVRFTPDCSTDSLAEYLLGGMIAAKRSLFLPRETLQAADFAIARHIGSEFRNWTVGIVGLGKVGSRLATLCSQLGMKTAYYSRERKELLEPAPVYRPLGELIASVDVLAVTCSFNPTSSSLLGPRNLSLAKADVAIVSIARSGVFELEGLTEFFAGRPSSFLVTDHLPLSSPNARRLAGLRNVITTPHIAFNTEESLYAYMSRAAECVEAFVGGSDLYTIDSQQPDGAWTWGHASNV